MTAPSTTELRTAAHTINDLLDEAWVEFSADDTRTLSRAASLLESLRTSTEADVAGRDPEAVGECGVLG